MYGKRTSIKVIDRRCFVFIHVSSYRLGEWWVRITSKSSPKYFCWAGVPSDETTRGTLVRLNLAYLKTPRECNLSERARCPCCWLRRGNQRYPWLIALGNPRFKLTQWNPLPYLCFSPAQVTISKHISANNELV